MPRHTATSTQVYWRVWHIVRIFGGMTIAIDDREAATTARQALLLLIGGALALAGTYAGLRLRSWFRLDMARPNVSPAG